MPCTFCMDVPHFQAFMIFARLLSPSARQALGDLCRIALTNPEHWRGWLAELVTDEASRSQIEHLILKNLKDQESQQAEKLRELKEL